MVALEISEEGVFVGELVMPPIHPAALLFSTRDYAEIEELRRDILRRGLQKPISLTPNGELLEGRGRWRACQRLGLTPRTTTVRSDPWIFVITANWETLAPMSQPARAMLVGRVPRYKGNNRPRATPRYEDPPTVEAIAEAVRVQRQAVGRCQRIFGKGIEPLHRLVSSGAVPIYTAVRVADLDVDAQAEYVARVLSGASPTDIAPANYQRERQHENAKLVAVRPARNRYVREQAVSQLSDALHSVRLIVDEAEGLDPCVTPELAASYLKTLAANHVAYRRLTGLLKARKEQPS
jgi:hypothetical protein